MKTARMLLLALTFVTAFAAVASAHTCAPRVDRRQVRQHARIHQGVRSGEISRGEAVRLRSGQRHVRRLERRATSDGVVTMRERARLERAQDVQSHRIYRLKHNDISR